MRTLARRLLVLPADTWFAGHVRALEIARALLTRHTPVAGICGATYGLARAGLLDERRHTSNALDFLTSSGYAGASRYVDERVVETATSSPLQPLPRWTSALPSFAACSCSRQR